MFRGFDDYHDYAGFGVPLPMTDLRSTPLHQAVRSNDIARVEECLRNGADVNVQDGQCKTPLQVAVGSNIEHEDIIRLLLQYGADVTGHRGVHGNALTCAAVGSPRTMKILLDHASAQKDFSLTSANRALYAASEVGRLEMVQLLLAQGVSPNAEGSMYGSALEAAAQYGSEDSVRALLDAGAEVNFQGGYHGNALQAAARYGHLNLVKILLEAGADINAPGGVYANALTSAIKRDHPLVVDFLLQAGATPVSENEKSSSMDGYED
ncbi:ankyrin repeat-containing domain protein [Aspergillus caelatus]|uniref:Ankyrin repeat-containing domain protein n=1 Tax=Aspergillus caelatus TaxID=61420 RepID=A0A5N7ALL0_9EURO|nr:ankyrin repeat-containing domain protein [Aspergillus caelatus]KAE8370593.1 ankyrin repeat-containing domain protein [Aspergillus caelatus]